MLCSKCKQPCSPDDQVKAFNQLYHSHCFTCEDCHVDVANNKYYFMEDQQLKRKIILCELDYLKRSNSIICLKCNKPITNFSSTHQQQRNYHPECMQCPSCFKPTQYQYEHKGIHYCRLHYSLFNETHCAGCDQAVLKQFVQVKEYPDQIWHPECYMIFKFWSIKLKNNNNNNEIQIHNEKELIHLQDENYDKIKRVWTDLSSFEESSANCISDMLLNVAACAYTEGIRMAHQFVMHLEVLFSALSKIQTSIHNINCQKEANAICQEMIHFFKVLTLPKSEKAAITQQLLSLVTSLAQNLKYLIRIGLSSSQILEQKYGNRQAIPQFLDELLELDKRRVWISGRYYFKDTPETSKLEEFNTRCNTCKNTIEDEDCFQADPHLKWHISCFQCSTCSTRITSANNAVLISPSTLYCTTCKSAEAEPSSPITLSYSYQQSLQYLKTYLAKVANDLKKEKKTTNDMILPKTKRQRSILRLLTNKTQQPQQKDDIHVGQIGHNTSATTLKSSSSIHKNQASHVPETTESASPTLVASSPTLKINKLSQNIKRTFTTTTKPHINRILFENTMNEKYMTFFTCSEDYILRHAAVIQLHTHLVDDFSLDELVSFMSPKKHHHHHPSALWNKLLVHLQRPTSQLTQNNNNKTFGMPLAAVAQRDHDENPVQQRGTCHTNTPAALNACFSDNAYIPIFIKSCITMILRSDMSVEGVFRKNGNIRQLKKDSESIDNLDRVTTEHVEAILENHNGVQLAALLKRYLRELPEPLFTFSLYKLFVQCGRTTRGRKRSLHLACCLLPKANRDTMIMLFCCLKWVSTFSDSNKMDIPNLARVIAPSVLYDNTTSIDLCQGAQEEINVIETLIRDIDEFSKVPYDVTLFTLQDVHHDMSDLNSKYFIAQYQKLLQEKKKRRPSLQITTTTAPTTIC